jgi:glycosyl transferase family 61
MMTQLLRKASARGRRQIARSWKVVKQRGARTLFQVPGLSHRDPRRHITRFKDSCTLVGSLTAEAASLDRYVVVRPPECIRREPPIALNDVDARRFEYSSTKYQLGTSVELPEVFVASIGPARLRNPDFLVTSVTGEIYLDSAHGLINVLEDTGVLHEVLPPKPSVQRGSYVLLASAWSERSYYHWLIDALPRLSLLDAIPDGARLPLIVPSTLHRYHEESLTAAGVAKSRQIGFTNAVQVDRLYYPGLLSPTGHTSPHAIRWLRDTFRPHLSTRKPFRRLYVTRRDTRRRILNEDEIVEFLLPHGFEVVCPGDMSIFDQVSLFSEAQVIVGPHGAGLTNIVFCPEGATVVELFGSNYINGCFWAITNLRRQTHAFATFDTDTLDYTASADRVCELLQKARVL